MVNLAERAMSFGSIADQYNRLRPSAPAEAIDWLVPDGCRMAVDLAAGTGLLSRALARKARQVLAVEPDERMRAVLHASTPDAGVVGGVGEALPLASGAVDALFISSAWHWLDPERAVPEITRVLRDGGRFGVVWTSRDRSVDWVNEIRIADARGPADGAMGPEQAQWRHRSVQLPDSAPLAHIETQSFRFTRTMTTEDFVAMLGTYSAVITATAPTRDAAFDRVRTALAERFPGAGEVEVPMATWCWRADRVPR
jgi:SAM-dependent methyltransferase